MPAGALWEPPSSAVKIITMVLPMVMVMILRGVDSQYRFFCPTAIRGILSFMSKLELERSAIMIGMPMPMVMAMILRGQAKLYCFFVMSPLLNVKWSTGNG